MKTNRKFIMSGVFAILTLILIFMLKNVNIRQVGPWDKSIGLASINLAVFKAAGGTFNRTWYTITMYIGVLALCVGGAFAILGLYQLIRRRSILKVDMEVLTLGFLYVLLGFVYIAFDKIPINYRPIIIPGAAGPEASFPSSHTMLTFVILVSASMVLKKYVPVKSVRYAINVIFAALVVIMCVGRVLSGVHWFTDVFGAVLISNCVLFLYSAILDIFNEE